MFPRGFSWMPLVRGVRVRCPRSYFFVLRRLNHSDLNLYQLSISLQLHPDLGAYQTGSINRHWHRCCWISDETACPWFRQNEHLPPNSLMQSISSSYVLDLYDFTNSISSIFANDIKIWAWISRATYWLRNRMLPFGYHPSYLLREMVS